MRILTLFQPNKLAFGLDSSTLLKDDFQRQRLKRSYIVTAPEILSSIRHIVEDLEDSGIHVTIDDSAVKEPSIESFTSSLQKAMDSGADSIIGIGGGSVLDVSKLIAALYNSNQKVQDLFGIDKLKKRELFLICLPTTSGTGSEVSPNSILLDESDNLKKGVISRYLVPDAAYIDPKLTLTVPPGVTAATGMDALTHCIEAYANKFAHPIVDLYAIDGMRLISKNLVKAYKNGYDIEARENLALGSLYGGLCLGPVNTGAVHALSYPLGGEYHIAHGLSNALLLPHVIDYNISAAPQRYAEIAMALGVEKQKSDLETAKAGVQKLTELLNSCGLPSKLSEIKIPENSIPELAKMAVTVQRLLKNNLKEVTVNDAERIYEAAF